MEITGRDKRILRASAHHLNPLVLIGGNRVTDGMVAEIDRQLEDHELIKARLIDSDKAEVAQALEALLPRTRAVHVQTVGHVLVLFRRNPNPKKRKVPPLPCELGDKGNAKAKAKAAAQATAKAAAKATAKAKAKTAAKTAAKPTAKTAAKAGDTAPADSRD